MQIYTNNNSSFPDQVVPDSVKESWEYGKKVAWAIEGDWFSGTRSGVENRFDSGKRYLAASWSWQDPSYLAQIPLAPAEGGKW